MQKYYLCIDLKTFYASVECVERGLDPFTTNLVVADPDRSVSTICLAITPAMKKLGIRNRCRIHEIPDHIEYIVAKPRMQLYMHYNPFHYIRSEKDILKLVNTIIANTKGEGEKSTEDFWISATRSQTVKSLRTSNGFPLFGELVV